MQACRNRQHWGWNHANRLRGRALAFGFQHRLRHFLDEQRDAVGALDDVLPDVWRQQLVADNAVDHGVDVALCQPIYGQACDARLSYPRSDELGARSYKQQNRKGFYSVHRSVKCLEASWISPMHVLEDH